MGFKGDKEGANAGINAEALMEKLAGLGEISAKKCLVVMELWNQERCLE